jgi:hypothetical protein
MILLQHKWLQRSKFDGLVRLARFLGVYPTQTTTSIPAMRAALIANIMRAEKLISRMPKAKQFSSPSIAAMR